MSVWLIGSALLLLIAVAVLHLYWALGGRAGAAAALPRRTDDGPPLFMPRKPETVAVGLILLFLAFVLADQGGMLPTLAPNRFTGWVSLLAAIVFLLRSVGDFKYMGFGKKIKSTRFAYWDTRLYTPLCLWLSLACWAAYFGW